MRALCLVVCCLIASPAAAQTLAPVTLARPIVVAPVRLDMDFAQRLEARLVMPDRARAIERYDRTYRLERRAGRGVIVGQFVERHAGDPPGSIRVLEAGSKNGPEEIVISSEDRCGLMHLEWNVEAGHMLRLWCN